MRTLGTGVLLALILCGPVFGGTIQVPADQQTIQAGIDAAFDGDTVLVADGVYDGPGNLDITFNGKAVVLKSVNGAEFTTILYQYWDGGNFAGRCLQVDSGEGPGTVVDGFTFANYSDYIYGEGRAMYIANSSPTVKNCRIVNFRGGSPVVCENASPLFDNCVWADNVSGCSACKDGKDANALYPTRASAVLCTANSSPEFRGCLFQSNIADVAGGALVCDGSSPTLVDCRFLDNIGYHNDGAAVECWNGAAPLFVGCEFTGNYGNGIYGLGGERPRYAGAVYSYQSSPQFEFCQFDRNRVYSHGQTHAGTAVLSDSLSLMRFTNCTFTRNRREGFFLDAAISTMMTVRGGSIVLENSIVAHSIGAPAAGSDLSTASFAVTCSDIFGNEGGDWTGPIADQLGVNGNLLAHPLFCDTAAGDFHVAFESPCAPGNNSCGVLIGALSPACACCRYLGDADYSSSEGQSDINVGDVTYLVGYLYRGGPPPPCPREGDADGDGDLNIGDATFLVLYLFRGGAAPGPCNQPMEGIRPATASAIIH